jgi:Big-like domain-containing protein
VLRHQCTPRAAVYSGLGFLAFSSALACGDHNGPVVVTSVAVTSPIGSRMFHGRSVQLIAVAKDARGNTVSGVEFAWTSTDESVATVSATGVVTAVAAGSATVRAKAQGTAVEGGVGLQVNNADPVEISASITDPFTVALAASLTSPVRTAVQAALAKCADGLGAGNFTTIETCFADVRTQIIGATDPTDRALLASVALFIDHAQRLLNS